MSKRVTSLVLAGVLGLGAGATSLVVVPAVAMAQTSETSTSDAVSDRVTRIKEALAGLVGDGSITQAQADEVATTLAEQLPSRGGRHGGGRNLAAAAEVLGITADELRTALEGGRSIADVAAERGVEKQAVVDALVAAATERIDAELADGRLTQAQADERKAELVERVTAQVERAGLPERGSHPAPSDEATTEPSSDTA